MPFQSIPGIEGRVFVPDEKSDAKKHPCRDCYACQQCSDDRCRICRAEAAPDTRPTRLNDGCRCRRRRRVPPDDGY